MKLREKVTVFTLRCCSHNMLSHSGSDGKESASNAGDLNSWVRKIPLETGMATHSSIPAWEIPWTEEPGGL